MIKKGSLTLLLLSCLLTVMMAQSAQPTSVVFILDASGSMWAKMDNSTRIEQAKSVMTHLADKIHPGSKVGLIAYGHTSASDCNDISTLIAISEFNKQTFLESVRVLQPKGKTPIARAVQHALDEIKKSQLPVSLVLVTDGLETCDGDACALMNKARAEGVHVTMHVIGFGIAEENLSSLECLAQAGGGQYLSAENADELTLALEQSIKPQPVGNAWLSVRATLEGKLKDATVRVNRTDIKAPEVSGRTYDHAETNPRLFQLEAGTYAIEIFPVGLSGLEALNYDNLQLTAGDTIYREVEFQQAVVKVLVTRNGKLSDGLIHIMPTGSSVAIATARSYDHEKQNPATLKIPPGTYDIEISAIEISGRPSTRIDNWSVSAAGVKEIAHDFPSGELSIGATVGNDFVDATINVVLLETGLTSGAGRTYMSASSDPKKFILSPGKYRVDLGPIKPQGLAKKSIEVEVIAGQEIKKTVTW